MIKKKLPSSKVGTRLKIADGLGKVFDACLYAFDKVSHPFKKVGQLIKVINTTSRLINTLIFAVKYIVIPVGTQFWSDNIWLKVTAIIFGVIVALYDVWRKKQ